MSESTRNRTQAPDHADGEAGTIHRKPRKQRDFTMVDNPHLRRNDLSWKAKGLLTYLVMLPDGWNVHLSHLAGIGPDGFKATRSGLRELTRAGYLTRTKWQDERGRWRTRTDFDEDAVAVPAELQQPHGPYNPGYANRPTPNGPVGDGQVGKGGSIGSTDLASTENQVLEDQHPHSVAADAATAVDDGKPARQGPGEDVTGRFKAEVEGRRAHRKTRREATAEADVPEPETAGWSDPSTETLEQVTWDLPVRRNSRGERVYTAAEGARLDAADARDRRLRGQTLGQVIEAATGRLDRLSPSDLPPLDRALAIGGWASEARQAGYEPNVPTLLGLYDRMVERARPRRRIARASAADSGPRGHFARLVEHDDGGLADAVAVALAGADPFDADLGHLDDVAWAEALVEAVRDHAGVGYHASRPVA